MKHGLVLVGQMAQVRVDLLAVSTDGRLFVCEAQQLCFKGKTKHLHGLGVFNVVHAPSGLAICAGIVDRDVAFDVMHELARAVDWDAPSLMALNERSESVIATIKSVCAARGIEPIDLSARFQLPAGDPRCN